MRPASKSEAAYAKHGNPIEGLCELTRRPSRALASPPALLPELQRVKQGHSQVCRARRGGSRTLSKTTDANLDCASAENPRFHTNL